MFLNRWWAIQSYSKHRHVLWFWLCESQYITSNMPCCWCSVFWQIPWYWTRATPKFSIWSHSRIKECSIFPVFRSWYKTHENTWGVEESVWRCRNWSQKATHYFLWIWDHFMCGGFGIISLWKERYHGLWWLMGGVVSACYWYDWKELNTYSHSLFCNITIRGEVEADLIGN